MFENCSNGYQHITVNGQEGTELRGGRTVSGDVDYKKILGVPPNHAYSIVSFCPTTTMNLVNPAPPVFQARPCLGYYTVRCYDTFSVFVRPGGSRRDADIPCRAAVGSCSPVTSTSRDGSCTNRDKPPRR